MIFFSDIERGLMPRTIETIPENAWKGIISIINISIDKGAFKESIPSKDSFRQLLESLVPNIKWPLYEYEVPDTIDVLDLIQFCHNHIAKPVDGNDIYGNYTIQYDTKHGQNEFRERINLVFSRNGLIYELQDDGSVIRRGPPVLCETLIKSQFNTGDIDLNVMLEEACRKALNPESQIRREAVERLWDAWERLKTIEKPDDKRLSVKISLDKAASEPKFRDRLEIEAKELSSIGNDFLIRHSEINKPKIERDYQSEYLFYRLLSLIWLLLQAKA